MPRIQRRTHKKGNEAVDALLDKVRKDTTDEVTKTLSAQIDQIKKRHTYSLAKKDSEWQKFVDELKAVISTQEIKIVDLQSKLIEIGNHDQEDQEKLSIPVNAVLSTKRIDAYGRMTEDSRASSLEEIAKFRATYGRTRGVQYKSSSDGTDRYSVAPGVDVSFRKDSPLKVEDELRYLMAVLSQKLLEGVLLNQRGTLITDPIHYTGNVGVFVRGGSALDAAQKGATLRSRE